MGEVFVHTWDDWSFSFSEAYRNLVEHFKTQSLEGFGCENMKAAISSAGALIHYLRETQKSPLDHITALTPFPIHNYMALDQCSPDKFGTGPIQRRNQKEFSVGPARPLSNPHGRKAYS